MTDLEGRIKGLPRSGWKRVKKRSRMNYDQGIYSLHCDSMGIWVLVDGSLYGKINDQQWFLNLVEGLNE